MAVDGTPAADCYRAMASVELNLQFDEEKIGEPNTPAMLLALADVLLSGTLNDTQWEALGALRAGLLRLARPPQSGALRF